jgi:hypothetical protein
VRILSERRQPDGVFADAPSPPSRLSRLQPSNPSCAPLRFCDDGRWLVLERTLRVADPKLLLVMEDFMRQQVRGCRVGRSGRHRARLSRSLLQMGWRVMRCEGARHACRRKRCWIRRGCWRRRDGKSITLTRQRWSPGKATKACYFSAWVINGPSSKASSSCEAKTFTAAHAAVLCSNLFEGPCRALAAMLERSPACCCRGQWRA